MKKFGSGLTGAQMRFAREIEAAGLASISQAVKAFERGEVEKIEAWKLALAPKPEVAESQNEEPSDDGSSKREEAEQSEPQFTWTETQSGYLSEETFSTKAAAVNAARGLRVPTDAKQDEYGDWHLYSRWNPATPRTHGGPRPGAGRKPDSAKVDQREPLYQQGYGAGYHAALRSKLAAGGWLVRRYGSQWEYEAPDHAVVPVERELAEALVEQGIVVADSANSGEEDRWMVFKLAW